MKSFPKKPLRPPAVSDNDSQNRPQKSRPKELASTNISVNKIRYEVLAAQPSDVAPGWLTGNWAGWDG